MRWPAVVCPGPGGIDVLYRVRRFTIGGVGRRLLPLTEILWSLSRRPVMRCCLHPASDLPLPVACSIAAFGMERCTDFCGRRRRGLHGSKMAYMRAPPPPSLPIQFDQPDRCGARSPFVRNRCFAFAPLPVHPRSCRPPIGAVVFL